MDFANVLSAASEVLMSLPGKTFDVINIAKPGSLEEAELLFKTISKLSPLVGNLIEFHIVEYLTLHNEYKNVGKWVRQDPGFPDATFLSPINPAPGVEIKAWFPLSTEITARFKDSQSALDQNNINLALVAWLPEHLIWGKPVIIDIQIIPALSIAKARDDHYCSPPHYLVIEPEDTSLRSANLQQSNTNGYVIQDNEDDPKLIQLVQSLGLNGIPYSCDEAYQNKLKAIMNRFKYRLDTNYAKIDRIDHTEIEALKERVLQKEIMGASIRNWNVNGSRLIDKLLE